MSLTENEITRYQRHLVLKGIGGAGQNKLKAAHALVVGAGGLGSPVIAYLAAAGVGRLTIIDDDVVALSNLQRQIIHRTKDVGIAKTQSAASFVAAINPEISVEIVSKRITSAADLIPLLSDITVVLDGTDNISARRCVADACAQSGTMLVSGAVSMFDGQLTVFLPPDDKGPVGAGFDDLHPQSENGEIDDLPNCAEVGIVGAVTGVIGSLMAMEAIKLIVGTGEIMAGRILYYDGRSCRFTELAYGPSDHD